MNDGTWLALGAAGALALAGRARGSRALDLDALLAQTQSEPAVRAQRQPGVAAARARAARVEEELERVTFDIAVEQGSTEPTRRKGWGLPTAPGLVLHQDKKGSWTLTHRTSGKAIANLESATRPGWALEAVGGFADWTLDTQAVLRALAQAGVTGDTIRLTIDAADPDRVAAAQADRLQKQEREARDRVLRQWILAVDARWIASELQKLAASTEQATANLRSGMRPDTPIALDPRITARGVVFSAGDLPVWDARHFGSAVGAIVIPWSIPPWTQSRPPPPATLIWGKAEHSAPSSPSDFYRMSPSAAPLAYFPFDLGFSRPVRPDPLLLRGAARQAAEHFRSTVQDYFAAFMEIGFGLPWWPRWIIPGTATQDAALQRELIHCDQRHDTSGYAKPRHVYKCVTRWKDRLWVASESPMNTTRRTVTGGYRHGDQQSQPYRLLNEVVPAEAWNRGTWGLPAYWYIGTSDRSALQTQVRRALTSDQLPGRDYVPGNHLVGQEIDVPKQGRFVLTGMQMAFPSDWVWSRKQLAKPKPKKSATAPATSLLDALLAQVEGKT